MSTMIVARKKDGTMVKGKTGDFRPSRNVFHVTVDSSPARATEVFVDDLKAVFFVKALKGSAKPHSRPHDKSSPCMQSIERKVRVTFMDDEVMDGYTHSVQLDRLGFFMQSSDPDDNNQRIFVLFSFVKSILLEGKAIDLNAIRLAEKICECCGKKLDARWKYCPFDGKLVK